MFDVLFSARPGRRGRLTVLAAAIVAALSSLAGVSSAHAQQQTPGGAPTSGPAIDPLAGPIRKNDTLRIEVVGDPKLSADKMRVDNNGMITMAMVRGRIGVVGLQPTQAANRIADTLVRQQILRAPQVAVYIVDRPVQTVTVNGAVGKPGAVAIRGQTRLSEVLEPAGVTTEISDLKRVVITRGNADITVNYYDYKSGTSKDDRNNPLLQDNDKIYVFSGLPQSLGTISVAGEVVKPITNAPAPVGLTAGQALQQAGGVGPNADKDKIVIRRNGTEIPVPYKDIREGNASKDIPLQQGDDIFVPRTEQPKQFSVTGAVVAPRTYPLDRPLTLIEAVTVAGGPVPGARDIAVELKREDERGLVQTKVYNIKKPEGASVAVQPNDIINVPISTNKGITFEKAIGTIGALSGLFFLFGRR